MNIIRDALYYALLQVVTFVVLYEGGWHMAGMLFDKPKVSIIWGISIDFAFNAVIYLSILNAGLKSLITNRKPIRTAIVFAFSSVLFALLFIDTYSYHPLRMVLVLGAAITAFSTLFAPIPWSKKYNGG